MADILARILATKREEIARAIALRSLSELRRDAQSAPPARAFAASVREAVAQGRDAVIAEVKRASPSKGMLRPSYDVASIATAYASAGATCLSVLTDARYFQGDPAHLGLARGTVDLPVLRKDFVIDAYQVYESRALGADCILLIAAALERAQLIALATIAHSLGMSVLVEVHDERELEVALEARGGLIGINNRDLRSFETRLETTWKLLPHIPEGHFVVTESGIRTRADVEAMRSRGVRAFLVGEAFMRAPDPGTALRDLFFAS